VKYLREVMLQYKKASLLPQIGWDFATKCISNGDLDTNDQQMNGEEFCLPQIASASLSAAHSSKSDTKLIPLLLCHVTSRVHSQRQYLGCVQASFDRATFDSDQLEQIGQDEGRVLLLYSPDLKASCAIRFVDPAQCFVWSNAIQTAVHTANSNAVSEANLVLRDVLDSATIKHMGWLNERLDDGQMRCTFLVLTNKELLFYDFVPWTAHSWAFPVHSYPLIHCRLVHPGQSTKFSPITNSPQDVENGSSHVMNASDSLSTGLTIRFGTTLGVVVVQLFSESQKTLLQWANSIIHNANNAALAMGEATFGITRFSYPIPRLTLVFN
jgi:hypothetical protein